MKKTSVYLTEDEVDGLRRLSSLTGKSQAELLRESVRALVAAGAGERTFHSMGKGRGPGYRRWEPGEVYEAVMGRHGPDR